MTLSEEDKKRIEEEERYRNEIRKEPKIKKSFGCLSGCLTIVIIFVLLGVFINTLSPKPTKDQQSNPDSQKELIGDVNIKNGIIYITNNETTDWTSCYFNLNSKYGYPDNAFPRTRLEVIKAKEIATIRVTDFVTSDGIRFNIFTIKPQDLMGKCQNGFQYWKWN